MLQICLSPTGAAAPNSSPQKADSCTASAGVTVRSFFLLLLRAKTTETVRTLPPTPTLTMPIVGSGTNLTMLPTEMLVDVQRARVDPGYSQARTVILAPIKS